MGEKHKYGMQVTLRLFSAADCHKSHKWVAASAASRKCKKKKNRGKKAKQRRQLNISHQLLVQLSGNVDGPFLIYSYDNAGIRQ